MDAVTANGKQRVSWRRIGLCLLAIFVVLYLLLPVAEHVMDWHFAHSEAAMAERIMPKPLLDTSADPLKDGEALTSLGYSLRVPWRIAKRDDTRLVTALRFGNGASVSIVDMRGDNTGPGLIEHATPEEAAKLKQMYGSTTLSSRYEFLRTELNASPSDVSFWRSNLSNARSLTLLMLKGGLLQKAKSVYSITASHVHGFQIGDADSATVHLILFDEQDRELWILCHPPSGSKMTQAQVNGIVASINPINPLSETKANIQ